MRSINLLPAASDNMGGLQKLQFLPFEDVVEIPYVNMVNRLQIAEVINTGRDWYDALGTFERYFFECNQAVDDHGEYFAIRCGFHHPKLNTDDSWNAEQMKWRRFIVLAYDQHGNIRVCGTLEEPMMFNLKATTGQLVSDLNGMTLEFSGNMRYRPPYYYGEGSGAGFPGDFNDDFSPDFLI